MRHGWNTTCFQIVNPGIEYWFGDDGNSVVGYVESKGLRVVAGAPVCPKESLPRVSAEFEKAAGEKGLGVCYFGAEARLDAVYRDSTEHSSVLLGAQPVWHPVNWRTIVNKRLSLRAQFNRARNKGVKVREMTVHEARTDQRLRRCLHDWLESKGLPPLHFVIEPETLERLENRRVFVAEREGDLAAFLTLSPIPQRAGWLTEQFPHHPSAPNGTVELMMDTAIQNLADEGYQYITLGLSPLSKRANIDRFDNPAWLRFLLGWMRRHGRRFYNFDGLDHFKSKLLPEYWEPVFAISNERQFSGRSLWAIASAFSDNRPFTVFAGGILKAARTEFSNFSSWMQNFAAR